MILPKCCCLYCLSHHLLLYRPISSFSSHLSLMFLSCPLFTLANCPLFIFPPPLITPTPLLFSLILSLSHYDSPIFSSIGYTYPLSLSLPPISPISYTSLSLPFLYFIYLSLSPPFIFYLSLSICLSFPASLSHIMYYLCSSHSLFYICFLCILYLKGSFVVLFHGTK